MERRREFIINALYFAMILGLVWLFFKYLASAFLPFFIGALISAIIEPLVSRLSTRFKLKRKPTGIFLLIILYSLIGLLVTVLTLRTVTLLGELMQGLPELYSSSIEPMLRSISDRLDGATDSFYRGMGVDSRSDELDALLSALRGSIGSAVSDISVKVLSSLSSFAAGMSGFLIQGFFALLSSFFFTLELERITGYLKKSLPDRICSFFCRLGSRILGTLWKYAGSYALIMLITFAQLSLGLMIIGTEHPFAAAFGISLFDILPVLGSGGVLIPWAVWRLIGGDTIGGVGLIVLWGVVSIVRNLIEPRIVGKQVGLHPLAALISMYVGAKLFGFLGLFLLPIGLSVLVSMNAAKHSESNDEPV